VAEADDVVHGPLEILCTVDEEVGLSGAMKLKPDFLKGRIMLNLDGEEPNAAYIGCAGGGDTSLRLKTGTAPAPAGMEGLLVKVSGLKGGHSGCDIHLQRGNALRVLARCLWAAREAAPGLRFADLKGGNKRNAIPRESEALILAPADQVDAATTAINAEAKAIREELKKPEPDMAVIVAPVTAADTVVDEAGANTNLNLLHALPHGVERYSDEIHGLVETSCNMASMRLEDGLFRMELSTRSSVADSLKALRNRIAAVGALAGAEVEENNPYPGWKPDLNSKLAVLFKEVHQEALGKEPSLEAIHAGLETGVIGEKFPGMDMISFGPWIEFPHSPDERTHIGSVQDFWKLLKAMLARLAG
jgi:dipeptidase D